MLTETTRELLTAFLDGELGQRQRKSVLRLLRRSSEARGFLKDLQENAHLLKQLPHKKLPADFPQKVLQAISDRGLQIAPATLPLRPTGGFKWARWAVAAAVLIAVGFGTYAFYHFGQIPNGPGPIAVVTPEKPKPYVGVRLAVTEFKEAKAKERLAEELKQEVSLQFDVAVANFGQAVQRMESAFKTKNIKVLIDSQAKARLKENRPKTDYVVYAENLSSDEVIGIIQQLGDENDNVVLQTAMLNPLSAEQRGDVARALGLPVNQLQPASKVEAIIGVGVELPEKKKKDTSKGKAQPGKTKEAERLAVVLALTQGGAEKTNSAEIRRFLENRRPLQAGTLQFVVLIHESRV